MKTYLIEFTNCFDIEANSYEEAVEKIRSTHDFNNENWQEELFTVCDENGNVIDED